MKTLIYSDVHGNLPAFESILKSEGKCDAYISLGDLVNYGPWSNECVDLAMSLPNSTFIMGNHEDAFINGFYPGSNLLVQLFFQKTFANFTRNTEIKTFISAARIGRFCCRHTIEDQYIYPDTAVILNNNYIIGHSHHQFKYCNNGFELFNAGSVGQNRKLINVSNYLVFQNGFVEMKARTFDVNLVIQKMEQQNYPVECINYYKQKPVM